MTIYKITNNINTKIYIGQTIQDINLRWNSHKSLLRKGNHPNDYLQASWIKYGEDSFIFEILEIITDVEILNDRESFWIGKFNSINKEKGYNLQSGGQLNRTCSAETRLKMSKSSKGKPKSPEHIRKSIETKANKNIKPSLETRAKISASMKGKVRSKKHSENIAKSLKGKKYKPKVPS
jgi:group I intron endonuclease